MAAKRGQKKEQVEAEISRAERMGALCSICPLKPHGPPVFGEGPTGAKLAIVGEAPGRNEVAAGRPFIGLSGELLENYLGKHGVRRQDVLLTNAIMCFPPGGDMRAFMQLAKKQAKEAGLDFHHPVDCCRPRLMRELGIGRCSFCRNYEAGPKKLLCVCKKPQFVYPSDTARPDTVCGTGNMALYALHGVEGIQKWRGSPLNKVREAQEERARVEANMKPKSEKKTKSTTTEKKK